MVVRVALRKLHRPGIVGFVAGVTITAVVLVAEFADGDALRSAVRHLVGEPLMTTGAIAGFGLAFAIRAVVWTRVLPGLSLGQSWAGIHVALAGNHVLPLRLGEPLRVLSVARRTTVSVSEATASSMTLRSADLLAVLGIAILLGAASLPGIGWPVVALALILVAAVGGTGVVWIRRLRRAAARLRWPGPTVLIGTIGAWLAEAGLVWVAATAAGIGYGYLDAVFVTSISVAAQVAAVGPGGFGTYEAGAVAAYVYLGHDPGVALAAALAAHGLKTAYSLLAGATAVFLPRPSLLGRLRLPKSRPRRPAPHPVHLDQPVVVFMPAHDEEGNVARVVRRVPQRAMGHRVVAMVVDDGSQDRTAQEARNAGAEVITLSRNRGLGAAVRRGLEEALDRNPAAVVFLDADGEYAPEEMEHLVAPVLSGRADYVVGSRFAGRISRMLPHRRVGNRLLTAALSLIARRRIGDGQSGYRVLSRRAAEEAEILHDYNYAQVLTLDLLGRGFGYHEVPISYHFRTSGSSFVRLGRYLRNVLPTVYRVLNRDAEQEAEPVSA